MSELTCKLCRAELPEGAIYCANCDSYQDCRRHFKASATVLALLVALLAVATSTLQVLSSLWPKAPSEISISRPAFYGTQAAVTVTNAGDLSGSVEDGILTSPLFPMRVKLEPSEPEQRLIASGSHQLVLDSDLRMSVQDAMRTILKFGREEADWRPEERGGTIEFGVRSSDGQLQEVEVDVSRYELMKFLVFHFEACARREQALLSLDKCMGDEEWFDIQTERVLSAGPSE